MVIEPPWRRRSRSGDRVASLLLYLSWLPNQSQSDKLWVKSSGL
ncbi:hypothetical protein PN466_12875 [Roseofilum reptotaenium CS-1145]|nr:hypothetical protein [Roseofilum reptotaenium CS-1145]